jgi:putative ABC transport system permease protein
MRSGDLVRLSLSALWQQKARLLLTTLGVIFGAFVLAISLSLGQGVQRTIETEAGRNVDLRKIDVYPKYAPWDQGPSKEMPKVEGKMSEERRQRLTKALASRKKGSSIHAPQVPLDRERLRILAEIEHVRSVTPMVGFFGWAALDGPPQAMHAISAVPGNPYFRDRIMAGEFFTADNANAVVLSELLCYRLGLVDEQDLASVLGKVLRLELRYEEPQPGLAIYIQRPEGGETTHEETIALEKIRHQLPAALPALNLSEQERNAIRKALTAERKPAEVCTAEYPIIGVLRLPDDDERPTPWSRQNISADIVLPVRTATELFFRQRHLSQYGVDDVTVEVDQDKNVRPLVERIREMGVHASAPLEYIEREQFTFQLIFAAMSCIAAVALIVAALGIANTMLMSVLERTREIGIMKAVGAADRHVLRLFLIEGALIGLVGGALGLLLGWGASFPGDAWVRSMVSRDFKIELKESLFVFPVWLLAGVPLFAIVVTTFAALYPARRAARVNPLEALRHE